MRILLIHQMFLEDDDPGGSRFNEFTKHWASQGHEVTVLAGMIHYNKTEKRQEYKGKYFVNKQQANVNVWRCHISEAYNKNFLGRLWGYFSFMFSSFWCGFFKVNQKFDIILVTSPPLFVGITAYLLSRLKGIPFLFEIRDLWPESAIDTGILKNKLIIKLAFAVEKLVYKKAKLINVLTPAFRQHLVEKKGIDIEKIIFIPNAADFGLSESLLQNFDATGFRKNLGVDDKFIITYVGAHGVANHLDQILKVAKKLEDTNVLFWLIGEGMEKQRLMKEATKHEVFNVHFLPSVPKKEVFKYILASNMGASVLKKVDTFKTVYSNKSFDYMACKKPILMAIDGVSRQLVEQADAGKYVEPENVEEIERAVRFYLSNPEVLKQQGENGYTFAQQNFDRTVLANKYIQYLQKLI